MLKQPDFCTKILMIASGLPRLYSRHHWFSGSTIARVPSLRVQTGICCCALVCILRDSLAPVLLVWVQAGADIRRAAALAATKVSRRIFTPVN